MASRAKQKRLWRSQQQDSRKDHYVTAAYIGLFGKTQGRRCPIHVYDREQGRAWMDVPENVAYEVDLYRLDPGDPPHAMEEALAPAEGAMVAAIQEIERQKSQPTVKQAEAVVSFVSLQVVRMPEMLENFNRFSTDTAKLMVEVTASHPGAYEAHCRRMLEADPTLTREELPTAEEILDSLNSEKFEMRMNNGYVVSTVFKSQEAVFKEISDMEVGFYWVFDEQQVVTGNRPVVLLPGRDGPPWGPGVRTAEAIVMPLTPKLLFMARPGRPYAINYNPLFPPIVTEVNRWVSHQSRFTFSRTSFEFDPTPLNEPAGTRKDSLTSASKNRTPAE